VVWQIARVVSNDYNRDVIKTYRDAKMRTAEEGDVIRVVDRALSAAQYSAPLVLRDDLRDAPVGAFRYKINDKFYYRSLEVRVRGRKRINWADSAHPVYDVQVLDSEHNRQLLASSEMFIRIVPPKKIGVGDIIRASERSLVRSLVQETDRG
jgi:hypothetical protein